MQTLFTIENFMYNNYKQISQLIQMYNITRLHWDVTDNKDVWEN